jgi:hypothetical protein
MTWNLTTVSSSHVETFDGCLPRQVLCPNQNGLKKALEMNIPEQERENNLEICRRWAATEGVDKVIEEHGVEVIVDPRDRFFCRRWCWST